MKKNFFKKMAFVLAAALVVPMAAAPGGTVKAAKEPALAKTNTNVYEGNKYTYTMNHVASGQTVKWTLSGAGKDYAILSQANGKKTQLSISTGKKMGAKNAVLKITGTVYDKNNKVVKAVADDVKIKVNATNLGMKLATANVSTSALPLNTDIKFNRIITPANATSATYWSVADAQGAATSGATISSKGVFRATTAGQYKIVAVAKNAKNGAVKATATMNVTAGTAQPTPPAQTGLLSVTQTELAKLTAVFGTDLTSVKASDFTITKTEANVQIPVSINTVALDGTDKKKVVIDLSMDLRDGKIYTVSYGGKSVQFTATDGKVASVGITPSQIPYDKETVIYAVAKDAKGIVVEKVKMGESSVNLDVYVESNTSGYVNEDKLYLPQIGNTAKATVTYHTNQYDSSGNEVGAIKNEFTITAVNSTTAIKEIRYSIDTAEPNWKATKVSDDKHAISIGDTLEKKVWFYITDINGNDITTDYKISSSNENSLLIDSKEFYEGDTSSSIAGFKQGTYYILIQDKKNSNTVGSAGITVRSEGYAATMVFGVSSLMVAGNNGSIADAQEDIQEVSVEVRNQYGEKVRADYGTVEPIGSAPYMVDWHPDYNKLTVNGSLAAKSGTFTYRIKAEAGGRTVSKNLTVTVKMPTGSTSSYDVMLSGDNLSGNKVDISIDNTTAGDITLNARVVEKRNGVYFRDASNVTKIEMVRSNNTVVDKSTFSNSFTTKLVSLSGDTYTKQEPAGSYRIIATYDGSRKITKTITIVDSQPKPTYQIVKRQTSAGDANGVVSSTDYVKFLYNGQTVDSSGAYVNSEDYTQTGNSIRIKKAMVPVDVGNGKKVIMPVTMDQTFSLNQ